MPPEARHQATDDGRYRLSSVFRPDSWPRLDFIRRQDALNVALAICVVVVLLAFALHAIDLLYEGRYSVTRQDYWRIYNLDLRLPFPLNALYKHNDHPVFFPSLIWLPILYFCHNDQTLLFFCGLALTLTSVLLLFASLWRSPTLRLVERLAFGLIDTIGCLWMGKANITASGGFSCMNSLAMIGVIAALLSLGRLQASNTRVARAKGFAGIILAALVASFSFGTGLAIWPVLMIIAAVVGLGWGITASLGCGHLGRDGSDRKSHSRAVIV